MQQTIKGLFLNDCHWRVGDSYQTLANFSAMFIKSVAAAAAASSLCTYQGCFQGYIWWTAATLAVFLRSKPDPTVTPAVQMKWNLRISDNYLQITSSCPLRVTEKEGTRTLRDATREGGSSFGTKLFKQSISQRVWEWDRKTDRRTDGQTWMALDLDSQL